MARGRSAPNRRVGHSLWLAALGSLLLPTAASAQPVDVPAEHPRVYVRAADLPDVQAKLALPEFAEAWSDVQACTEPLCLAFVSLVTGDAAACQTAIADGLTRLQAATPDDIRVFDQPMHWGACVYDWCYAELSAADQQAYLTEFERLATGHDPGYPADPASPAVVGHVTEGYLLTDQLPAGLAIYDESPAMFDAAASLFFDRFVEVRDFYYPAHMHHQGDSYFSRFMHDQAASWLFRRIGAGDALSREQSGVPYQVIYHLRPDGQQMRSGDTYDDLGRSSAKRLILMLTGSYYEDPVLLGMSDSDVFWSAPEYHHVLELLFRPAGLATEPIDGLPLSKYFPMPMGEMVARSGWTQGVDSPDAVVHMRIGGTFFGNHQRKDWGTFQIYRRGPLAIASGVYEGDTSAYGTDHWLNYYHQSIAHNALLVFDPDENMDHGSSPCANDGGQRWPNDGRDHPADLASLLNDGYDMGLVTAHAMGPDPVAPIYSYLAGDITNAYASSKASLVTRSMVTLNTGDPQSPAVVVVFDRVTSESADFRKTWLLHSIQEPTVDGHQITVVRDGPTHDDTGAYGGQLFVDSLLPEAGDITLVGGAGQEFWIESVATNYATTKDNGAEPGAWRVEVSPSAPATSDRFLHVLTTADAGQTARPEVQRVEATGRVGASVLGFTVLFADAVELHSEVEVNVAGSGEQAILLVDVEPGVWAVEREGQPVGTADASIDGQALFVTGDPGQYRFTWGEPPPPPPVGGAGGATGSGGSTTGGTSSAGMDPGVAGAAGTSPAAADANESDSGCGCRLAPDPRRSPGAALAMLGALLLLARRRQRGYCTCFQLPW